MKTTTRIVARVGVGVALALGLVAGGAALWAHRPWRPAVLVNGRALTVGELDLRARTLLDDARRTAAPSNAAAFTEAAALPYYRRQAAKMWIVKETLLAAALARGVTATPADEKASLAQIAARLKSRGLTPEQFFREGPLPEDVKRRDFREGVLIDALIAREVRDKIDVPTAAVDARLDALRRTAGDKTPTRRQALAALRAERFREGFRRLCAELFQKTTLACPAYPDLEDFDELYLNNKKTKD